LPAFFFYFLFFKEQDLYTTQTENELVRKNEKIEKRKYELKSKKNKNLLYGIDMMRKEMLKKLLITRSLSHASFNFFSLSNRLALKSAASSAIS